MLSRVCTRLGWKLPAVEFWRGNVQGLKCWGTPELLLALLGKILSLYSGGSKQVSKMLYPGFLGSLSFTASGNRAPCYTGVFEGEEAVAVMANQAHSCFPVFSH